MEILAKFKTVLPQVCVTDTVSNCSPVVIDTRWLNHMKEWHSAFGLSSPHPADIVKNRSNQMPWKLYSTDLAWDANGFKPFREELVSRFVDIHHIALADCVIHFTVGNDTIGRAKIALYLVNICSSNGARQECWMRCLCGWKQKDGFGMTICTRDKGSPAFQKDHMFRWPQRINPSVNTLIWEIPLS